MPRRARSVCALALVATCFGCIPLAPDGPELAVFAAASLSGLGPELAAEFEAARGVRVIFNFASSNALAQQILAAPVADLFISADRAWVDVLEQAGVTVGGGRDLFGNRLVAIANRDVAWRAETPRELADLEIRFLAVADPDAVPAGRYARAALEQIDVAGVTLWDHFAAARVPTLDVRAALALVASDPEIVGVVYRTDAMSSDRVRILCELDQPLEAPPIAYRAVLVAGGDPELAGRFLDFLNRPEARAIASRHGFEPEP